MLQKLLESEALCLGSGAWLQAITVIEAEVPVLAAGDMTLVAGVGNSVGLGADLGTGVGLAAVLGTGVGLGAALVWVRGVPCLGLRSILPETGCCRSRNGE